MLMMIPVYIGLIIVICSDILGLSLASILAYVGYKLYRFNWREYLLFSSAWITFALARLIEATYLGMLTASFLAGEIFFLDPLNSKYSYWWVMVSLLDFSCFFLLLIYQRSSSRYLGVYVPILTKAFLDIMTFIMIIAIIISQIKMNEEKRLMAYIGYILLAASYLVLGLIYFIYLSDLVLIASLMRLIGLTLLLNIVWRVE